MSERECIRRQKQSEEEVKRRFGSERDVSAITGIPVRTLQKHRLLNRGLPFYRHCGRIFYDLDEIVRIIEASRVEPGGQAA